jgi:hypothetical protein
MTNYGRLQLAIEFGLVSDYSDAAHIRGSKTFSGTGVEVYRVNAAVAGKTLELGLFTSIAQVIILNHDTSLAVTATFTAASTVSKCVLAAADAVTSPSICVQGAIDPTADLVLTSSSGSPACTVVIFGTLA